MLDRTSTRMKNLQRHLGAMLVIAGVVLAFGGKEQKERRQDHSLHEASAESTALNGGAVFKFGRTLSIGIVCLHICKYANL